MAYTGWTRRNAENDHHSAGEPAEYTRHRRCVSNRDVQRENELLYAMWRFLLLRRHQLQRSTAVRVLPHLHLCAAGRSTGGYAIPARPVPRSESISQISQSMALVDHRSTARHFVECKPMIRTVAVFLVLILVGSSRAQAQSDDSPFFETRAAWVATVWRLDWPPAGSATLQEQRLRSLIRNMKNMGMNTVVFQAMSHGEAMYPSERLPWANWLTGTPGVDPGYDPLEVAIDEAHSLGMELHVWMNVFHIAAATSNISETAEPLHVRFSNPEWVVEHTDGSFWGNPGIPDFRRWQVDNVLEVVQNYDLDAIHFDYMRYPHREGLAGDVALRQDYPNDGTTLQHWRRENISNFVRDVYAAVKDEKPWVKVASAPIGAYKWYTGAPPAFWGYDDVYQDGRLWLEEGVMDYVAPQLYFTIGTAPLPPNTYASPDFRYWARDWRSNSHGRHIYTGHGTYLETSERRFPQGEIGEQIAVARAEGADGQVHFRYANTTSAPFGGHYDHLSLPPAMDYLDAAAAPQIGETVSLEREGSTFSLSWEPAVGAETDPLRRYAVLRRINGRPSLTSGAYTVAILGPDEVSFAEDLELGPDEHPYYRIVAQSQLGMTSFTEIATTDPDPVSAVTPGIAGSFSIDALFPNPATDVSTIRVTAPSAGDATVRLIDLIGRVVREEPAPLLPGSNELVIDVHDLSSGLYVVDVEFQNQKSTTRLIVVR